MQRIILFCLFLLAFSGKVRAQIATDSLTNHNLYQNSVYAEGLGNGAMGSLNYERLIWHPASQVTYAFRIGGLLLSAWKEGEKRESEMIALSEITVISGKRAVKFEAGAGLTFYRNSYDLEDNLLFPVLRIGARWQPVNKPYLVRLGFTPLFLGNDSPLFTSVIPYFGLSLGYSFGKRK